MRRGIFYSAIILFTTLSLWAIPVAAQTVTAIPSSGTKGEQRITNLKSRGDREIDRRIAALNSLLNKINGLKKLSASDKTTFSSQIQTEISNLTELRVKIDADSDLATLRNDVKSIVSSYRVFLLFMPKIRLLAAADRMSEAADNLSSIATKLQGRIQQVGSPANLQAILTDMMGKIADSKNQYQAVENEVPPLTPDGYPGNKATLDDARGKIKAGAADLKGARDDARQIRALLRTLKVTTSNSTQ